MTFFKLLTSDYRPPVQGGEAVWDGKTLPFELPPVRLDTSDAECSFGWNYVDDLAEGFRIAHMWPTGRPNIILVVTPSKDHIKRGKKLRASSLTLERLATEDEIRAGLLEFSRPFGKDAERMADEQLAWRSALSRPAHNPTAVKTGLAEALVARGLGDWTTELFESPQAAWAAWHAWDAWAARDARAAWAAWHAWDAWDAWDAWAARDAWDAWDAWDVRDVKDALTVCFAALQGWTTHDPLLLTTGIRDAYAAGLEITIPTGPKTLGFAMAEAPVVAGVTQ